MFVLMYYDYDNTDCHGVFSTQALAVAARETLKAGSRRFGDPKCFFILPITVNELQEAGIGFQPSYWQVPQP